MKKILLISVAVIFLGLATHAYAQGGFVPLAEIPGLTKGVTADTKGIADFLNNLYKFLIGIAAISAVIMIIWGGINISTQDSVSKQGEGRERIQNAILGLVLVLSPVLVFSLINPSILNLSLNIPKINLSSAGSGTGSGGGTQTTTSNGSTQNVSGTYLKTATFSSNDQNKATQAATDWVAQCTNSVWGGVLANSAAGSAVGSCPGGYNSSGVCVGGTQAATVSAICVFASPSTYTFVDISTGWFGSGVTTGRDYQLKPTDSSGATFVSQCTSDGGTACVSKASPLTNVNPCSGRYSFTIPPNAHNAKTGGDCYQASLVCVPTTPAVTINQSQSIGLCKSGASITN